MLRLVVICILIINSIFWGFYPVNELSPHQKILKQLGFTNNISKYFHIFLGMFFYVFSLLIAHNVIY